MAREGGNERSSFPLFLVAWLVSKLHETMYNIQNFGLVVLLFTFNYENKRARNDILDSAKLEGRLEGEEKRMIFWAVLLTCSKDIYLFCPRSIYYFAKSLILHKHPLLWHRLEDKQLLPSVNKKRPKLLSAINNLLYLHIYKYDYGAIDRDVSKEVAIYLYRLY